jgi:hypothetical protein
MRLKDAVISQAFFFLQHEPWAESLTSQ